MTTLDWIIVAIALLFAVFGYLRGFIVGALSLGGFAAGALLGARVGPLLLPDESHSPYAPLFALAGALLVGGLLSSVLETVGMRARRVLRLPGLGLLDGLLGALLTAALALGLVWIAGAVVLQTPGIRDLRHEVQRSKLLSELNEVLPPSGPILNALARFDPLPRLPGPGADVPPPSRDVLRQPGVRAAAPSVVRILGNACGLGVEGSGWVADGDLVVTNAHVVAGQDDTIVQERGEGRSLDASVVHFDARNDVAVLRVPELDAPPLGLVAEPASGTAGAILGFPHNGPFDVRPARIGATRTVLSDDAYGNGPVSRSVTTLRGLVRSGNSGGPVVDAEGRVLTTVFAATTSGDNGGYGVPNAVVRSALAGASRGVTVSSGPCAR
ncbi:MarP family serine protease [Conexibacter woesei]|uniref:Colicin V production protein n=1 Tax=Conexibacter woesei (strain DSM 14684 / CCUG 47730 / CIP 108061 / JCM 11494 / NBRC 100937 / ID131577) TaxID=469383 RepID=D3F253_CONWI|nr:MarP family serine protease [Conexibacter woesei]ADB50228.1 Colicin V production protein [Conexibacter woesei DSM 14684]